MKSCQRREARVAELTDGGYQLGRSPAELSWGTDPKCQPTRMQRPVTVAMAEVPKRQVRTGPRRSDPKPPQPTKKTPPATKDKGKDPPAKEKSDKEKPEKAPCPWPCQMVPVDVPGPGRAQAVLHPRKDVFVLKVSKVSVDGVRRSKLELELVTPKAPERRPPGRLDTREAQCEEPIPCCCRPCCTPAYT